MSRFRKYPTIYTLEALIKACDGTLMAGLPDGRYVPARAEGFCSWRQRWKAARLVFTGQADAIIWPGKQ